MMRRSFAALVALIALAGLATALPVGAGGEYTAEVTVTKVVEGPVPDGTIFEVEVACTPGGATLFEFPAQGGMDGFAVTEEVDCVVSEPNTGGADSVTFACNAIGDVKDVECDSNTEFQIDANDLNGDATVEITVTNSFDPAAAEPAAAEPAAAEPVAAEPTFTG